MKDGRLKRICGGCKHQKMIVDIKSSTGSSSNTQAFMDKMRATFSTLELENMEVMSEVSNQYACFEAEYFHYKYIFHPSLFIKS